MTLYLESLKSAKSYGLGEFLEIIGELSQESTKKGSLGRLTKELITYGIALEKQCERCIGIHQKAARKLGASDAELEQVRRTYLFMRACPNDSKALWKSWKASWRIFVLGRSALKHHELELIAAGISLVRQSKRHIELHSDNALEFGATKQQVFEVMPLALSQIPVLVNAIDID